MCSILNVPRSTYYSKKNPKKSEREIENEKLKTAILKYYKESKCRYGAQKIKIKMVGATWILYLIYTLRK